MVVKEKVPSPTPPRKGEGLTCRTVVLAREPSVRGEFENECGEGRTVSPSPLWGGVGEVFLP